MFIVSPALHPLFQVLTPGNSTHVPKPGLDIGCKSVDRLAAFIWAVMSCIPGDWNAMLSC